MPPTERVAVSAGWKELVANRMYFFHTPDDGVFLQRISQSVKLVEQRAGFVDGAGKGACIPSHLGIC